MQNLSDYFYSYFTICLSLLSFIISLATFAYTIYNEKKKLAYTFSYNIHARLVDEYRKTMSIILSDSGEEYKKEVMLFFLGELEFVALLCKKSILQKNVMKEIILPWFKDNYEGFKGHITEAQQHDSNAYSNIVYVVKLYKLKKEVCDGKKTHWF